MQDMGMMQNQMETSQDQSQGESENVSPEEQAQYDEFVKNGYALLYGDSFPTIIKRIQDDSDPVNALADVVANIVARLVGSAQQAGKQIPGDIVMHGGVEILEDLAMQIGKLKIHEYTDQELEKATYRAADTYRELEQQTGMIDQQGFQQDWQQLQQANQSGQLDQMMGQLQQQGGGKGLMQ